jgi:uncharacterized protein with PQ loop repeat
MISVNKTFYYYLISFAIFMLIFSFIPLVLEIIQKKITSNIPYITLICMLISFLIFLFITISRQYYIHIFLYLIALISISIIIFLKRNYEYNKK